MFKKVGLYVVKRYSWDRIYVKWPLYTVMCCSMSVPFYEWIDHIYNLTWTMTEFVFARMSKWRLIVKQVTAFYNSSRVDYSDF